MNNRKLIKDEPIILDNENDFLGTRVYSNELEKIISESLNTEYIETIALFGDWGIGKSSIINTVKKSLNDVEFVYYDSWKYSNDSFSKSFLYSLDKNYESELYHKITTTNKKISLKNITEPIAILFICVLVIVSIFSSILNSSIIGNAFLCSILASICAIFSTEIINWIIVDTSEENTKELSLKDFSDIFSKIIKNKYNRKKTVFVIDDLDRCSYSNLLLILESIHGLIKNKENQGGYLFLIPIDKKRLLSALGEERRYNKKEFDKYVDKLFDITIEVLEPNNTDCFNLIKECANDIGLDLSGLAINLLSDYVKTPRDIKKTLSCLLYERELLDLKKNCGFIEKEISNNELVKFYILKKKWINYYESLLNEDSDEIGTIRIEYLKNDIEFSIFDKSSQSISIENIRCYGKLRNDDIDKTLENKFISIESIYEECDENLINSFGSYYKLKITSHNLYNEFMEVLFINYLKILNYLKEPMMLLNRLPISDVINDLGKIVNDTNNFKNYDTIKELIDAIYKNHALKEYGIINILLKFFNNKKDIELIHYILMNRGIELSNSKLINESLLILISCNNREYQKDLDYLFDDELYLINAPIMISCINNKLYNYLNKCINYDSNLVNEVYYNTIIKESYIVNYMGNFSDIDNSVDAEDITSELKCINLIIENKLLDDSVLIEIFEHMYGSNIIHKMIVTFNNNNNDFVFELAQFINNITNTINDNKYIKYVIENRKPNDILSLLTYLFDLNNNIDVKFEIICWLLVSSKFDKTLCKKYVDFCNNNLDYDRAKNISIIYKNYSSVLMNTIQISITMKNKQPFINNFIPELVNINDIHFNKIVDKIGLNPFINCQEFSVLKFSNMKKKILIENIKSYQEYDCLVDVFGKSGFISNYCDAISNMSNNYNIYDFVEKMKNRNLTKKEYKTLVSVAVKMHYII